MAALVILLPLVLAACAERPAYVIDPERSAASYPAEHPYYTVTVREGDNIARIAERCDTNAAAIADLNDIDEGAELYPGQVLRVPRRVRDDSAHAQRQYAAYVPHPIPRPHHAPVRKDQTNAAPKAHRDDVAANQTATQSADNSWWSWWMHPNFPGMPAQTDSAKFVWPVQGHIIEGFGGSKHGERNDGINIAADDGTPIRAAAAGTVTYTGNELKGYGNLVLIRHDNGFVTAYAHAGSIRVTRGDVVTQGEVIGTAGETGDVDRPQLHFEIRKGVQAVDPIQYLNRAS